MGLGCRQRHELGRIQVAFEWITRRVTHMDCPILQPQGDWGSFLNIPLMTNHLPKSKSCKTRSRFSLFGIPLRCETASLFYRSPHQQNAAGPRRGDPLGAPERWLSHVRAAPHAAPDPRAAAAAPGREALERAAEPSLGTKGTTKRVEKTTKWNL